LLSVVNVFRLLFKICQEASPKTKVTTIDSARLPRQTTPKYLAQLDSGLGILNI
jgi:hypothetical protein